MKASRPARTPALDPKALRLEVLESRCLLSAGTGNSSALSFDSSQILVRFRADVSDRVIAELRGSDTQIGDAIALVPGLRTVRLSGITVDKAIARFKQNPLVLYAEPDYTVHADLLTNDPKLTNGDLWGLHNTGQKLGKPDADIDAPEAWSITTGSANTIVAIIDTGINYTHPDLAANVWKNIDEVAGNGIDDDSNGFVDDIYGYDFANNDADPKDDNDHGSHTAGTIGAVGNNGKGVVGVNWQVKIMGLKFLNAAGSGSTSNAIRAINYAVANGAKISNNSWGGGANSTALRDAIQNAGNQGHLVVAAAGNGNILGVPQNTDKTPSYPASYNLPNIISVAATDRYDKFASFSNFGATSVDLAAPGVGIWSTVRGTGYKSLSGTSMATPHVAGAAALLLSANPSFTYSQLKQRILETTDFIGNIGNNVKKPTVTNGRLNIHRMLTGNTVLANSSAPATATASQKTSTAASTVAADSIALSLAIQNQAALQAAATDTAIATSNFAPGVRRVRL